MKLSKKYSYDENLRYRNSNICKSREFPTDIDYASLKHMACEINDNNNWVLENLESNIEVHYLSY